MAATRAHMGGATRHSNFTAADWLGLALFLAPIAIALLHGLGAGQ